MMSGNTLENIIRNENIRGKLELAPIEDKIRETRLRWFTHVERRSRDVIVSKSDSLEVIGTLKGRGRLKKLREMTLRHLI